MEPARRVADPHVGREVHDVDRRAEERAIVAAAEIAADVLATVALVPQRTGQRKTGGGDEVGESDVGTDVEAQRHDVGHHAAGAAQHRVGARRHRQAEGEVVGVGHPRDVRRDRRDRDRGVERAQSRRGIRQRSSKVLGQQATDHPRSASRAPDRVASVTGAGRSAAFSAQ